METVLAGRYHVIQRLGGGGFGQTFLAHDRHLPGHPICVVKQFHPKATDPSTLEVAKRLFDREAETLYRLGTHDRIPRLLAHFEQADEFYLAQEYIEGHPLDQELRPGQRYDEATTLLLLQDILEVLAFVHQQRVIHRDVKPANLIRRAHDNKIVLIDFGAVKEVSNQTIAAGEQTSSMTVAVGSPGYMPLEQQAFKPHYSSDIYAVGMIGMQALTGLTPRQIPRDEQTGEIKIGLVASQPPISLELATFLETMVRYDYRQRFQDASEALQVLRALSQSNQVANPGSTVMIPERSQPPVFSPEPQPVAANQAESQLSQLLATSTTSKKSLEMLLADVLGPIAPLILKQELAKAPDSQSLVKQLAEHLRPDQRAKFQTEASRLLHALEFSQTYPNPLQTDTHTDSAPTAASPASNPATPAPALEADLIRRCEQALAAEIGPIASLLVQRTLKQKANLTKTELIDSLAQQIPMPQKAEAFRQSMLSS